MNKKPWIKITLITALVAFVVVDLLLIATSTRVLAGALQPPAGSVRVQACNYFNGIGFETVLVPLADGQPAGIEACALLLRAA